MTHQPLPAFAATAGARQPRIVLVGEAWGGNEESIKLPFVGEAGKELWRMLGEAFPDLEPELHEAASALHRYGSAWVRQREAWLEAAGIAMTNVLALRPPNNKIETLCYSKKEADADAKQRFDSSYSHPPISNGKYLRCEFLPELDRLAAELLGWRPNLVVALGNTACWAVLRATNIGAIRGAVAASHPSGPAARAAPNGGPVKVLPSYHPAGVMRQWSWRPIVVADLMKARREAEFPDIRRPARRVLIDPTLPELREWFAAQRLRAEREGPLVVAADTETEAGQIRCISFAPDRAEAVVVPFWNKTRPGYSHWSEAEEREVWDAVQCFMEHPGVELCWQNGMYDYQYVNPMMISVGRSRHDTMLLHHSIYPEMQKGLGFLGSLYTNEASWKLMNREKRDSEKKDE